MGKVVAFSNQKGGVGKTSTCVNMAASLALRGYKVLLVDIDAQGNSTTGMGIAKNTLARSIYNVLIDQTYISDVIIPTSIEGLDILPSNIDLAGAEVELVYLKNREKRLRMALETVKNKYDYVMIDCPPSLNLLTINALTASDAVIIPIQCEFFAVEGLTKLLNTINLVVKSTNKSLTVGGIVLTMNDNRPLVSKQIQAELRQYFGSKVFNTVIPRNIRVSEAPSHGKPVIIYDPRSKGAKSYVELTTEFLQREAK
mgnify:FL=1